METMTTTTAMSAVRDAVRPWRGSEEAFLERRRVDQDCTESERRQRREQNRPLAAAARAHARLDDGRE